LKNRQGKKTLLISKKKFSNRSGGAGLLQTISQHEINERRGKAFGKRGKKLQKRRSRPVGKGNWGAFGASEKMQKATTWVEPWGWSGGVGVGAEPSNEQFSDANKWLLEAARATKRGLDW